MAEDQEMSKIKSFIELLNQSLTVPDRSGKIRIFEKPKNLVVYEKAERKGLLHPDTLSDHLASELSRAYSRYTIKNFGFILHHNFDKVGLVIDLNSDIKSAYDEIMSQRENYVRRIDAFIKTFLKNQNELKERWTDHIINLINSKQLNF